MRTVFRAGVLFLLIAFIVFLIPTTMENQVFAKRETLSSTTQNYDRVPFNKFRQLLRSNPRLFNNYDYDYTPYSEIPGILDEIEKNSNRVSVEVIGESAGGHKLYSVTIAEPSLGNGKYGNWNMIKKKMIENPVKAQKWIEKHPDFKVPVLVNGSIHGDEYVGTDAVLRLVEHFAYANDAETKNILSNTILVFNVVMNPDGRINGTRYNSNGIDLNRDFLVQTQPETKALVNLMTEWNPTVFLDLHGYVNLIEPTTHPYNPNYEFDLFIKWAMDHARAMENEVVSNSEDYDTAYYQNLDSVTIPYRDMESGWDGYPPIFTTQYNMYHGTYSYTLEAPDNREDGVTWHVNAVMGALKFAAENKTGMLHDQIEIFKRGVNGIHPGDDEDLYPKSYLLPVNGTDPTVTIKAVKHLLKNGVEVERAKKDFTINGEEYDAGTFVVDMNQAKAGMANMMLWKGEDVSDITESMYDIAVSGLPDLWGFEAIGVDEDIRNTRNVNYISHQGELSGKGPYIIPNSSVQAIALVNELLKKDIAVYRGDEGNFFVESQKGSVLRQAVKKSGLHVKTGEMPEKVMSLGDLNVAVLEKGGTKLALERLGFDVKKMKPEAVAKKGLSDVDVLVYSGSDRLPFWLRSKGDYDSFKQTINQFVTDGGKFIAVGKGASAVAKELGLTDLDIHGSDSGYSNAIVRVAYEEDSLLTAGYEENGTGFVYNPVWYTGIDDETVVASFSEEDFFKAGFWKDHEQAQGKPVIVREDGKNVLLMGLRAGFRNYPDHLYRLFSNAIYGETVDVNKKEAMKGFTEYVLQVKQMSQAAK
ncbi:M14 family zinc carboxypeptidase [Virgibacillus siamensis]|uniref:M14 family zinc carboxypeptidase n=1 Tax=Virgibacillus siamensis TaxID=480071 RepID=UPI0009861B5B|nr:M14 family zinc carboxypeptidase [Virgibacillus siamensis]